MEEKYPLPKCQLKQLFSGFVYFEVTFRFAIIIWWIGEIGKGYRLILESIIYNEGCNEKLFCNKIIILLSLHAELLKD